MAKILTTAIVADIRNKLNGSVFSKNRYGSYVRTKVTPVNPQTSEQQAVRNRLAILSAGWRGLTQAQRDSWINAAPSFPYTDIFGNVKILSGNALYVALNTNLLNTGNLVIQTAPTPQAISNLGIDSLTAAAGTPALSLDLTQAAVPSGHSMVVQATPLIPQGISFVKNRFRQIVVKTGLSSSPIDLLSDWNSRFGSLVASQQVFVRCYLVNDTSGQAGIPVQASTIVAA